MKKLLKGSDIDTVKVYVPMYNSHWAGEIWDSPDESGEEATDSVPIRPLTKQEITIDDLQGNNPQRRNTTNIWIAIWIICEKFRQHTKTDLGSQ